MQLYLPLAQMSLDIFLLLALGLGVGFIAGLFGVGGGFLLTPLLIIIGIPPSIAVGTVTAQIAASSASGALSYHHKKLIDFQMAGMLLVGSVTGALLGVLIFRILNKNGQLDVVIAIGFTVLLGFIGQSMVREGAKTIFALRRSSPPKVINEARAPWHSNLPFQIHFKTSKLTISAIPVIAVGFFIGLLGAILGIGGGFLLVPALIYILKMPTKYILGTTLFLTLVTMVVTTIMQSGVNQAVDAMLALPLIIGGVVGAQFGVRLAMQLRSEWLRLLLGTLLLLVAFKFLNGLLFAPLEPFSMMVGGK